MRSLVAAILLSLAAFPAHHDLLTDDAAILTTTEAADLEQQLRSFEQRTSVELAIVTVKSLEGMSIEEYTNKLFHEWGIGKRGKDNGILLLFAPTEGKVKIETGYGVEAVITDGTAGDIIRNDIRPGWRSAHRATGVIAGAQAIMREYDAHANRIAEVPLVQEEKMSWFVFITLIAGVVLLVGVVLYLAFRGREDEDDEDDEEDRDYWRERIRRESASYVRPRPVRYAATPPVRAHHHVEEDNRRSSSSDLVSSPSVDWGSSFGSSSSSFDSGSSSSSGGSSDFSFGGGDSGGGGASGAL